MSRAALSGFPAAVLAMRGHRFSRWKLTAERQVQQRQQAPCNAANGGEHGAESVPDQSLLQKPSRPQASCSPDCLALIAQLPPHRVLLLRTATPMRSRVIQCGGPVALPDCLRAPGISVDHRAGKK